MGAPTSRAECSNASFSALPMRYGKRRIDAGVKTRCLTASCCFPLVSVPTTLSRCRSGWRSSRCSLVMAHCYSEFFHGRAGNVTGRTGLNSPEPSPSLGRGRQPNPSGAGSPSFDANIRRCT